MLEIKLNGMDVVENDFFFPCILIVRDLSATQNALLVATCVG